MFEFMLTTGATTISMERDSRENSEAFGRIPTAEAASSSMTLRDLLGRVLLVASLFRWWAVYKPTLGLPNQELLDYVSILTSSAHRIVAHCSYNVVPRDSGLARSLDVDQLA
jgi:hypothetical protein